MPTTGYTSWFKLVKKDLCNYFISDGNNLYKDSDPFFILCPWCFGEALGGVKPYVTRTVQETKKISALPITTYTEQPELYINASTGECWTEDEWGNKTELPKIKTLGDTAIHTAYVNGEMRNSFK